MRQAVWVLLAAAAMVVAGCAAGAAPRAVVPETRVDFGDVPVVTNMNDAKLKRFVIQNAGTADLKLSNIQVKTLEGC